MSDTQRYIEIPIGELAGHATVVREALEVVCESAAFRTSPKSCQFLRHIVDRSIAGETDELKERLIGMLLMRREATYDTASDAGVRVRANDVRKRLTVFNSTSKEYPPVTFGLPSGTYVPRFHRLYADTVEPTPQSSIAVAAMGPYQAAPPITFQRLAAPTVMALFLCVMCLRWQIAQEHPFTAFWQGIFQQGPVFLYLPPANASGQRPLVGMQEIETSTQLLNLAGQFRSQVAIAESPQGSDSKTLITIGDSHQEDSSPPQTYAGDQLTMMNTASGRKIVDKQHPSRSPIGDGAAGLLTIEHTPQRRIVIDGTDDASVQKLVRLLCERDAFPDIVADNDQAGETMQFVFPMTPAGDPIVYRNATKTSPAMEGGQR